jgi:AraC family transcriptional regulator, transcriptional activator of pobA
LAALVGWPSKRLARVFAARYGMPPGQYRLHAAMERAADLLRATALPMSEIAERLGYPDVRFFIRQFGKVHGVPPATWRRGEYGRTDANPS